MAVNEDSGFESRIGKGTKTSGKLTFRGPVKIEGEAEGEITGDDVVIAQGAVVSARISAGKVTIAGAFNGEVNARERVAPHQATVPPKQYPTMPIGTGPSASAAASISATMPGCGSLLRKSRPRATSSGP